MRVGALFEDGETMTMKQLVEKFPTPWTSTDADRGAVYDAHGRWIGGWDGPSRRDETRALNRIVCTAVNAAYPAKKRKGKK